MAVQEALSEDQIYTRLGVSAEQLKEFCRQWQVQELAIFGSTIRDDFHALSDIDFLVTYLPAARRSLFQKIRMKEQMENLVNRKVDLVSKHALEHSRNWIRSRNIINSARVLYVSQSGMSP